MARSLTSMLYRGRTVVRHRQSGHAQRQHRVALSRGASGLSPAADIAAPVRASTKTGWSGNPQRSAPARRLAFSAGGGLQARSPAPPRCPALEPPPASGFVL